VDQVLVVLVFLMDEMHELCSLAESKFFPKLTIFGEPGGLEEKEQLTPGDRERRIGRSLPLLQVGPDREKWKGDLTIWGEGGRAGEQGDRVREVVCC
jgi:hypothetical protein